MSGVWPAKQLGELCKIARGGSPRPIKQFLTDAEDGVNWIKISDATASSKYIYETKQKIKPEGIKRSRMVHNGDFLLSNSMSFGRPYIMRTSGCIHDGWLVLGDISDTVDQDYLYYFLGSPAAYRQFDDRAAGSTVRNLNIDLVRSVEIPLPPLSVQQRIVTILDEFFTGIEAAIANTEKNIANARELFESYINAAFYTAIAECKELPIEKHIKFIDYRGKTPKKTSSGLRLITAKNVRMGYLQREPEEFVNPEIYDTWMTRGIPRKEDVLFTTEAPLGFACQLDTDEKVVFAQRIIIMQPDRNVVDPGYLKFALRSAPIQSRIYENATGATATGIKASLLKKITIPIPEISDQKAIADNAENMEQELERLRHIYQQKLDALTELKQSLLQKAFSGELTVKAGNVVEEAVA